MFEAVANFIASKSAKIYTLGFKDDFKKLMKIAIPLLLTNFGTFLMPLITIIFCGQIGKYELDAATLASTMANVSGFAAVLGLSSACETLFPQIYGSRNKQMLGVVLQKGLLINTIGSIPAMILLLNAKNFAILLNQETEIVKFLDEYMIYYTPSIFFASINAVLSKYIQCQNIVYPVVIISLASNVICIISNSILIFVLHLGIKGAGISATIANFAALIMTIVYIIISKVYRETWSGWSLKCLDDWWSYVTLAVPGLFMMIFEALAYEIGTFLTRIATQIVLICYLIPLSISTAGCICLGQSLGANRPEHSKNIFKVILTMCCFAIGTVVLLLLSLSPVLPRLFTSDKEINELTSKVLLMIALVHVFDGGHASLGGILKAIAAQFRLSIFYFVCYYLVALPMGLSLLLSSSLDIYGFWLGIFVGAAFLVIIEIVVIRKIVWEEEAQKAVKRTEADCYKEEVDEESNSDIKMKTESKSCLVLKRAACFIVVLLLSSIGFYTRSLGTIIQNENNRTNSSTQLFLYITTKKTSLN